MVLVLETHFLRHDDVINAITSNVMDGKDCTEDDLISATKYTLDLPGGKLPWKEGLLVLCATSFSCLCFLYVVCSFVV